MSVHDPVELPDFFTPPFIGYPHARGPVDTRVRVSNALANPTYSFAIWPPRAASAGFLEFAAWRDIERLRVAQVSS
jgi:hypothetical protein